MVMTFNELRREYAGFILRTSKEEWKIVRETKGKCKVEYNADCYDREVYFDVIGE